MYFFKEYLKKKFLFCHPLKDYTTGKVYRRTENLFRKIAQNLFRKIAVMCTEMVQKQCPVVIIFKLFIIKTKIRIRRSDSRSKDFNIEIIF